MFKSTSIPDRWGDYSNFKGVIKECNLLPCKTPLKYGIFNQGVEDMLLEECQHFTPAVLYKTLREQLNLKLEFIIDFTNTTRYYDRMIFENLGIRHIKINCIGRCIPPQDVYDMFHMAMDTCLERVSADGVIAVHCTHGINRSGYLVCNYLVNKYGFSFEQAVATFSEARGYAIERVEYLEKLKNDPYPAPTENTFQFQECPVDSIVTDSMTAPIQEADRTTKRGRERTHPHRKRKPTANPEPNYYPPPPPPHYPPSYHNSYKHDSYAPYNHYPHPRDRYRDYTYHDGYYHTHERYHGYHEHYDSGEQRSSSRYRKRHRKYDTPRTCYDAPKERYHYDPPPRLPPQAWGPPAHHPRGAYRVQERPNEHCSSHKGVKTYSGVPYIKHAM